MEEQFAPIPILANHLSEGVLRLRRNFPEQHLRVECRRDRHEHFQNLAGLDRAFIPLERESEEVGSRFEFQN